MKKHIIFSALTALILSSCAEFEPVFTGKYPNPEPYTPVSIEPTLTIAQLAAMYTHGTPIELLGDNIIAGRVSTTDQPGNFYKSFFIQDETGGIEIKVGKNGLYNFYKEGQMVYVNCDGLTLGEYGYKSGSSYGNGMVQLGFSGTGTDYETSYLELQLLIDTHIFQGDPNELQPVTPVVLSESQLPSSSSDLSTCPYLGKLVTVKNLSYGWYDTRYKEQNTAFALLYLNSQKDKKASSNRIFITGNNTGIKQWALSKERMSAYLTSGTWDSFPIGNANDYNYGVVGDPQYAYQGYYKDPVTGEESWDLDEEGNPIVTYPGIERAAYSVSQYFHTDNGTCIQIRTSGYGKFADVEIPEGVLAGSSTINVTGILSLYQGKIQITVNRISDITFN